FQATSVFAVELGKAIADAQPPVAGADYDQFMLTGTGTTATLSAGAQLSVTELANLVNGQQFTVLDNSAGGSMSGMFSDPSGTPLSDGARFADNLGGTFQINYADG